MKEHTQGVQNILYLKSQIKVIYFDAIKLGSIHSLRLQLKKVIVSQSNVNQIAYISTLQFGEIVESAV